MAEIQWAQRDATFGAITKSHTFHIVDNETLTLCGRHVILLEPQPDPPKGLRCKACIRSLSRRQRFTRPAPTGEAKEKS